MRQFTGFLPSLLLFFSMRLCAQESEAMKIAFLSDIHLTDLYGKFEDNGYQGIVNPTTGKYTLLRSMQSQLHSTRLFNENYFALLAALGDIAKRGVHIVALPGDYSDDGQALNVRGLQRILEEYASKYHIQFFITTGNHDPAGPFLQPAGKDDFMGTGGKNQPIYSEEQLQPTDSSALPAIVTKDIAKMGYEGIAGYLKDFGFFPKESYRFWATPFSSYTFENYNYEVASKESALPSRNYEVAPGYEVPDLSYVAEPIEGLWLLAIDGNTYIPKTNSKIGDPASPKNFQGADIGYNNVLSNKKHLVDWVRKIAAEANKYGKTLIAFSHYPMVEFNHGASAEIKELMGAGKWQLERVPNEDVAQAFADAGLKIHFAGHMHINETGVYTTKKGNTLVNVQTPSLAAYVPAYKLLTVKAGGILDVRTIALNQVPRFNELFGLYKMEHDYLERSHAKNIWDPAILKTKSYREFADYHLKELMRLRFLPDDWPAKFRGFLCGISAKNLLLLANMKTSIAIDSLLQHKKTYADEWKAAAAGAANELKKAGLSKSNFNWTGIDLITDFYRFRSADQLALADIPKQRMRQYKMILSSFFKTHRSQTNDATLKDLGLFLDIFKKFIQGAPADHFEVNLKTGKVVDLRLK
jgi:hypothetical protein